MMGWDEGKGMWNRRALSWLQQKMADWAVKRRDVQAARHSARVRAERAEWVSRWQSDHPVDAQALKEIEAIAVSRWHKWSGGYSARSDGGALAELQMVQETINDSDSGSSARWAPYLYVDGAAFPNVPLGDVLHRLQGHFGAIEAEATGRRAEEADTKRRSKEREEEARRRDAADRL
jgi:hypothetical protein